MYGYIYLITDTTNGKQYIGQHRYEKEELDPSYHGSGKIIKRIYAKRPETLEYKLLITADFPCVLDFYERYFIKHLNTMKPSGYNIANGGATRLYGEENGMYGVHRYGDKAPRYCKPIHNISKEQLYQEYVINHKNQAECSKIFCCSQALISKYLHKYQIASQNKYV